jgi:hypothetical protein
MRIYRHKWHAVGKHERASSGFGAKAGDIDKPFEPVIGRHLSQMVN